MTRSYLKKAVRQAKFRDMQLRHMKHPLNRDDAWISPDNLKVLAKELGQLRMSNGMRHRVSSELEDQDISAAIFILLANLPRLEELSIIDASWDDLGNLIKFPSPDEMEPLYSPNLKSFYFEFSKFTSATGLGETMPSIGISHLECFTAKNLFQEHAHTLDIVPELTLKTSIISLIDCCIPKTELGYILNACRCLKSFTYVVRHCEESYRDPLVLEPVTLMEMLNIQKHNLTKLHISFPCEVHIFKYGSFAGYPNLQYLRIEQGYLLKLQKFPKSLETLFFFG